MPYDFFSWSVMSMPTALAVDGHAQRTCRPGATPLPSALRGFPAARHPVSEKNEQ
jgi:hypothetical protein